MNSFTINARDTERSFLTDASSQSQPHPLEKAISNDELTILQLFKLSKFIMSKRHAQETLENVAASDSPAPKKVRLTSGPPVDANTDRVDASSSIYLSSNGWRNQDGKEEENHKAPTVEDENEDGPADVSPQPMDDSKGEESAYSVTSRQTAPLADYEDLYLDTIDRSVLDFDFEKLCSVTLSNINVYACLVCGKYYQGRGPKSHAYIHALDLGHHVFVNMQTKRVYVLPEGYEVKSKSLEDIKFVVDPKLSTNEVANLDTELDEAVDLSGKKYRPGMETPIYKIPCV